MDFEINKVEPQETVDQVEETKVETVDHTPEVVVPTAPVVEEVIAEQPKKKDKATLVAIFSPKKVSMDGVGILSVGINHVTKEDADKWLAAKHYVRLVEETNK
jgi:hypothetical protein